MTQLMLFSSLAASSQEYDARGEQNPTAFRYDLTDTYVVDNVQVKKDIRCTINATNYAFCGFRSIESVMAWNYLYQRMLDRESNYDEFTWEQLCKDLGFELDRDYYDMVLKSLLKVSVALEVRRLPFRFIRTFNSLCSRNYKNGDFGFALTLSSGFCGLESDFQQTIYRVLIENIQKSYVYPDDIEKMRKIARKQCRDLGSTRTRNPMDIEASVIATA